MHIRGNTTSPFKWPVTASLDFVSLLFKSFSLVNLKLKSRRAKSYDAYIISIDNLSFGGTGKTPLTLAIGHFLQERNIKFAIVTRGYKSKLETLGRNSVRINKHHSVTETSDEAQLYIRHFPHQDIYVGGDRHLSIEQAIRKHNRIILLDDGFQSTHIKKNFSIMLVNPCQPYYYLRNFKFLAHRENVFLFMKRCPLPASCEIPHNWRKVCSGAITGNYGFHMIHFRQPSREIIDVSNFSLAGFSALGDNRRFKEDLQAYNLAGFRGFSDHHDFNDKDLEKLNQWRIRLKADYLVCTEKDFVKCKDHNISDIPLIYAQNSIKFTFDLMNTILSHANESHNI